eukprot:959270-Alexandrium_andersonii.AAC.1
MAAADPSLAEVARAAAGHHAAILQLAARVLDAYVAAEKWPAAPRSPGPQSPPPPGLGGPSAGQSSGQGGTRDERCGA